MNFLLSFVGINLLHTLLSAHSVFCLDKADEQLGQILNGQKGWIPTGAEDVS